MTPKCAVEYQETINLALKLSRGTASQRLQAEILRQKAGALERRGKSSLEMMAEYTTGVLEEATSELRGRQIADSEYRSRFNRYLAGDFSEAEFRDFLAGTQSITYTQGAAGGYTVPTAYDATLREAMSQVDPVLDENVSDFSMTDSATLQPEQVSGYDLSPAGVTAQLIGESSQQSTIITPTVLGATLKSNLTFRVSLASSLESEEDIPGLGEKITRAAAVGLARKIGSSVMVGRGGTSDITGVTSLLSSSLSNGTGGKLTLTDFNNIYFTVNRWYRASKKCAWLMSDSVYKLARAAVDSQNRPLLNVERDTETIFGRPVYISPSLAAANSSIGAIGAILFGDFSHLVIRASRPTIQRTTEQGISDITKGECLFVGRCRADATVFDPSGGSYPPLVLATIN